jgi:5-oxopent-3-ene-1,2,5-tricarboxylate decarboxylase/2-hydroxyhepta-2,4-diene-1,7-dioate isomerase
VKVRTYVNGTLKQEASTAELIRSIPRLIAEVTEFMTLAAGDLLMIGVSAHRANAKAGDLVRVEVDKVGSLDNPVVAADASGVQA